MKEHRAFLTLDFASYVCCANRIDEEHRETIGREKIVKALKQSLEYELLFPSKKFSRQTTIEKLEKTGFPARVNGIMTTRPIVPPEQTENLFELLLYKGIDYHDGVGYFLGLTTFGLKAQVTPSGIMYYAAHK